MTRVEKTKTVVNVGQQQNTVDRRAYRPLELPALLGISQAMVYKQIASGKIRTVKIGARHLIPVEVIDELLRLPEATVKGG